MVSATFYVSVSPVHPDRVARQLRYMASDEDVRGRGYGRRVLEFAAHDLAALGVEELWANARDTALGFYRATGWEEVAGTQHLSTLSGIPHTVIVRRLVT